MSKSKLFVAQNEIGSVVTLFLTGGREVQGTIESVSEDYIILRSGGNQLTFFFEMIGGWAPVLNQRAGTDTTLPILDPSIFEIFKSKPIIVLPEANFKIDNLEQDDTQELVRAKNKYEYAMKVKELSRLHSIIPPLNRLADRIKNVYLFFLCGVLELKLGEIDEAEEFFKKSLSEPIPEGFIGYA